MTGATDDGEGRVSLLLDDTLKRDFELESVMNVELGILDSIL